jgi:hypothetical protein
MEIKGDYWKNLGTSPKPINMFKMSPYKFVLVSVFLLLFGCTTGSAQVITDTLPFCDMTKTPTLIDMQTSCHHSRVKNGKDPFFEKKFYKIGVRMIQISLLIQQLSFQTKILLLRNQTKFDNYVFLNRQVCDYVV